MPWVVRCGWAGCALLLAALSCYLWVGPDIFTHLFLGSRILETVQVQPTDHLILRQNNFINIYWLFQLLVTLIYRATHIPGLTALFFVVWLAIVYVWARTVGAFEMGGQGVWLGLVAIVVFATRFEPRPEVFSYLFCALQIYWLGTWDWDHPVPAGHYAIFALSEALWANMQGYFILGPALVGAKLFGTWVGRQNTMALRRLGALAGLTLAASICSPLGWGTWNLVWLFGRFFKDTHGLIQELRPPTGEFLHLWIVWVFWMSWIGTIVLGAVRLFRHRLEAFPLILAAAGLYSGATYYRSIPLFMILVGPLWCSLPEMLPKPARASRTLAGLALCATLSLSLWVITGGYYRALRSETSFGVGLSPPAYPVQFCDWLGKPTGGKLFNNDTDGGYLEFRFPEQRLYIDSRLTDSAKVRDYAATSSTPEKFFALQAAEHFDGALLKVVDNNQLIAALLQSPDWQLIYTDLHRAYFASRDSQPFSYPPPRTRRFYRGEDLSLRVNAASASVWIMLLAQTDQRQLLARAIDEISEAPEIPSFVFEFALKWAMKREDRGLFERVAALRPKMRSFERADQDEVDRLLNDRW
jgi:hypothetical protein